MNLKKLYSKFVNSLYRPEDDEQVREMKKFFFIFNFSVIPPVIGLTALTYLMDVPILIFYGWILISCYSLMLICFYFINGNVIIYNYIISIVVFILTLFVVIKQGGIPYSGGILYSSLAITIFVLIYNNIRLAVTVTAIYITMFLILFFLQPYLTPAPEMVKGNVNNVFTTLNAIWLSLWILVVIIYVFDKRAKEENKKRMKLKELDELKTKLFTNITHEFRTPLSIILGYTQLNEDHGSLSEHQTAENDKMKLIRNNAERLLRLVNQMLNLSKLETGNLPVKYVQTDVIPLLSYLVESCRSFADQKNVKLFFHPDQDQLFMDIDIEKMEDIVLNVIHNAIKFSPDGGEVIVLLSLIVNDKNGQNVQIKIKDNGIGIPEDKLDKIFDRFYQIDENSPEGSGIGLALTKEYVQLLGGEIYIKSVLNQGSTFTVVFPFRNNAMRVTFEEVIKSVTLQRGIISVVNNQIEEWSEKNEIDHKFLILIVEDNKELAYFLRTMLMPFFKVETAFDGREGVQKAFENIPDLIVSDVMMPIMDGFEMCDQLKNDFKTNHIPIILLTAKVDTDSKLTGLKKGADDYLAKPFNTDELMIRIKNLIAIREKLKQKYSQVEPGELNEAVAFTGLDKLFIDELNQLLDKHYIDEHFGIEQACSAMKISRVQLHRKLVALTGLSASHFISRFRVDKAAVLLRNTRMTVSEVAFEVGFHDANYFSRLFSKIYGISPGDYRKQKQ